MSLRAAWAGRFVWTEGAVRQHTRAHTCTLSGEEDGDRKRAAQWQRPAAEVSCCRSASHCERLWVRALVCEVVPKKVALRVCACVAEVSGCRSAGVCVCSRGERLPKQVALRVCACVVV